MEPGRTGGGDPARTIELLWRGESGPAPVRPGPRRGLSVDAVVAAAVAVADAGGMPALTMRAVAARLGVRAMSVYTYVPGKAELLDLMVDAVHAEAPSPPAGDDWRARIAAVAHANRDLLRRHPWLAEVSTARPVLGPGSIAKYERELGALDGIGLDDVEMDAALTLVLEHARVAALAERDAAAAQDESGRSPGEWWRERAPLLAARVTAARYPLATRVGTAAGAAQDAAHDAGRAFAFGLERILDGLGVLIARRASGRGG